MRPIEFRAWDKKELRMIDEFDQMRDWEWKDSGDFILMQFTGLLDKNGTKIFESDLTSDYDDGAYQYVIVWREERAQFMKLRSETYSTMTDCKHQTVIGNIYQSPELLK